MKPVYMKRDLLIEKRPIYIFMKFFFLYRKRTLECPADLRIRMFFGKRPIHIKRNLYIYIYEIMLPVLEEHFGMPCLLADTNVFWKETYTYQKRTFLKTDFYVYEKRLFI